MWTVCCEVRNVRYYKKEPMTVINIEKAIRMLTDNKLSFSEQLTWEINKANSIVGIMRAFVTLDEELFKRLDMLHSSDFIKNTQMKFGHHTYLIKDVEVIQKNMHIEESK